MSRPPSSNDTLSALPTIHLSENSTWYRIGKHAYASPVFWSAAPGGRYNPASENFGTCYMGETLVGAIAESICRNAGLSENSRITSETTLASLGYYKLTILPKLHLLDFTQSNLARYSLDARIYTEYDATTKRRSPYQWGPYWSDHAKTTCKLDGTLYPSRHHTGSVCLALFERPNSSEINFSQQGTCNDDTIVTILDTIFDWAIIP